MKCRTLLLCVVFVMAATAWAGLNDPAVLNPSFEADVLDPGVQDPASAKITDWYKRTSYCFLSEETRAGYPLTPYGFNLVEFGNQSWVYQQIGTWEENMTLEVSLLIGAISGKTFSGVHASLWTGGDATKAANGNPAIPLTTLETLVGATLIVKSELIKPDIAGGEAAEVKVTLSAGTGLTEGDPLWLLVQAAGAQRLLIDNVSVEQLKVAAVGPIPGYDPVVPVTTDLTWAPAPNVNPYKYDVYFGSDPNELSPGYDITLIVDGEDITTIDPAPSAYTDSEDLDYGKAYYWQVVAYEPNDPVDLVHYGPMWNFATIPPEPQIDISPVSATVAEGGTATFTIAGRNIDYYAWYRASDPTTALQDGVTPTGSTISGAGTPALTISGITLGDEDFYYCLVSNDESEAIVPSDSAQLMTERLVGWWKLDGNFDDSVEEVVPGAPAHGGTMDDPNFVVGGYDDTGGAIEFFDDGRIATITDSEEYFNFYPHGLTVGAWIKTDAPNAYATVVSKRNIAQNAGWMLRCPDTSAFAVEQASQGTATGQDSLADSQWHMITGRFDGKTVRLYVDGVLAAETAENTNTIGTHPEALVFGAARPDGNGSFGGLVDEIKIWSYALEGKQIAQMYANATGEAVCPEFPLYDFNENCVVDLADFARIAATWLKSNIVNP